MARSCSLCSHPRRAEIDAALVAGATLDVVVTHFGLPSRSAVQRHRAGHVGRALTFHLPPGNAAPGHSGLPAAAQDSSSALNRLFERALTETDRSLQDYVKLTVDGLAHVYATAEAVGDLGLAVRALRELRALLQLHALISPEKLQLHPGWHQPIAPRDPVFEMERLLLAQLTGTPEQEAAARSALDAHRCGLGSALSDRGPT